MRKDFIVDQGATFLLHIDLVRENGDSVDLTDATCFGKLRRDYHLPEFVDFVILSEPSALVVMLSEETTAGMYPGRWVFDVKLTYLDPDLGMVTERIVEGVVTVTPQATYE